MRKGCGSWECHCGGDHSIPFKVSSKESSVGVGILPAPKGTGIVASEAVKKILLMCGLKDVWVITSGSTSTRDNLISALFDSLKKLNNQKGELV